MHIAIKKGGYPNMVPLFAQFSMYTYVRMCVSKRGGRGSDFLCPKIWQKGVGLLPLFLYCVALRFGWLLDCWLALLIASAFLFDCLSHTYVFI